MYKLTITALILIGMTSAASARSLSPENQAFQRLANQDRRIEQGARKGDLTRDEVRHLRSEQHDIEAMVRRALRDGHFDYREARHIETAQNKASQHIRRERHDAERRHFRNTRHNWHATRYGHWHRRWW